MLVQAYVVGMIQANCYVVADEASRAALVIDPGDQAPELLEQIRELDVQVRAVFATHSHLDHTGGVHELLEALPEARFYMHALDYPQIAQQTTMASRWFGREVTAPRAPDATLAHGDRLEVGALAFTALHCPGHTPGSICLAGEGVVFTGDVLFAGSIGRSDLPGGDTATLIHSIRDHLLTLPDETEVYPGHNQPSSIGRERELNPYLRNPRALLGVDID